MVYSLEGKCDAPAVRGVLFELLLLPFNGEKASAGFGASVGVLVPGQSLTKDFQPSNSQRCACCTDATQRSQPRGRSKLWCSGVMCCTFLWIHTWILQTPQTPPPSPPAITSAGSLSVRSCLELLHLLAKNTSPS